MRLRELIKAWVEAFNARDSERLAAFHSDDTTNYQVPEMPVTGRDAIRAMFEEGFVRVEMVCIPENVFEDGEWGILEWRDPLGLRGCGFFHIVNGQIVLQRGDWDKLTFLRTQGPCTAGRLGEVDRSILSGRISLVQIL